MLIGPVDRVTVAACLGITGRQVQRLEIDGVLTNVGTKRGALYDLPASVQSYIKHKLAPKPETPRDQRDLAQAELTTLRLDRERGSLLPREQVVKVGAAVSTVIASKLRGLPGRLVHAGMPADVEPVVAATVDECLAELAAWRPDA